MLKIVIDTNVCISALLKPGSSQKILDLLTQDTFQAFYPDLLLEEIADVAARPKIASKYNISSERLSEFLDTVQRNATRVVMHNIPKVCRDPTDDPFLECARLTSCDYLISNDPDLLDLLEHGQTKIVSPAQFLKILTEHKLL